ncbi:MAG: spore germination protein [Firmicutes bacterium]|nr:spore germination protein [Bacillota bacterium]
MGSKTPIWINIVSQLGEIYWQNLYKGLVVELIRRLWRKWRGRKDRQWPRFDDASFSDLQDYLESEELTGSLQDTERKTKQAFGNSSDVISRYLRFGANPEVQLLIMHLDGMVDSIFLTDGVLRPVSEGSFYAARHAEATPPEAEAAYALLKQQLIQISAVQEATSLEKTLEYIGRGFAVLFVQGVPQGLACEVRGWAERDISEPGTEVSVRGSRQGFVENRRINTSMLRRQIVSPLLWLEDLQVGAVTKTVVTIAHIKGIAEQGVVDEVRRRIHSIEVDAILESGYIEEYIEDAPYSPFPTMLRTERPDKVAAALLEGKVAIITDGTPFVLVVPATFTNFLVAAEDYYERYLTGSFIRFIRLVAFFIALALPSTYVAITTFHQEMLPTPLILSIAAQREGVPFVAIIEALFLEFSFELLREAGIRLPKVIGPAISIVGALILGEAAVRAGLVSSALVIVVAATAIASFISPIYSMAISVHLLRFPMILLAGSLGLFGVIMGLSAILIHLSSLRSFGVPYLEPIAPAIFSEWKDAFIRIPLWMMDTRPRSTVKKEYIRQDPKQKPQPPKKSPGDGSSEA